MNDLGLTYEEALLAAATGVPVGYRPVLHPAVPPTHVGRIRGVTGAALLLEGRRRFVPLSHCTLEVPHV